MTSEIEQIQNEIGINVINLAPVPWKKIACRSICNECFNDFYYAFEEAETGIITNASTACCRFKKEWYKTDLLDIISTIHKLSIKLYCEYKKVNPSDMMWDAFTFILTDDFHFNIDFEYETPDKPLLDRDQWDVKYFGEKALEIYQCLYPDTTLFKPL